MRRWEFIALLSAAAVAWPFAPYAQPSTPVVGFLASRSPEDSANVLPVFREALKEAGFVDGQTPVSPLRFPVIIAFLPTLCAPA